MLFFLSTKHKPLATNHFFTHGRLDREESTRIVFSWRSRASGEMEPPASLRALFCAM